jgi:hypothetical protein
MDILHSPVSLKSNLEYIDIVEDTNGMFSKYAFVHNYNEKTNGMITEKISQKSSSL